MAVKILKPEKKKKNLSSLNFNSITLYGYMSSRPILRENDQGYKLLTFTFCNYNPTFLVKYNNPAYNLFYCSYYSDSLREWIIKFYYRYRAAIISGRILTPVIRNCFNQFEKPMRVFRNKIIVSEFMYLDNKTHINKQSEEENLEQADTPDDIPTVADEVDENILHKAI